MGATMGGGSIPCGLTDGFPVDLRIGLVIRRYAVLMPVEYLIHI
jgi:hypothetical protein